MEEENTNNTAVTPKIELVKEYVMKVIKHPLFISVIIAAVLVFVGVFIAVKWLDSYTEHGKEITVPYLKGMEIDEAENLLLHKGLSIEVVDSLYDTKVKPGAIVDQVPEAESKVKGGRKIYVYIRAKRARQVSLPNLTDETSRQAESQLESLGLTVKDIQFVASEHKDIVLGVSVNGKPVFAGTKLNTGTAVTLKVGRGTSSEYFPMVSLYHMNEESANEAARKLYMSVSRAIYDVTPANDAQKATYKIYKQTPITGTKINGSENIVIYLTTDKAKLDQPEETFDNND